MYLLIFAAYLILVALLRTRHHKFLQKDYANLDNPYNMGYQTAHRILLSILTREFPFMYGFATQFALIKSYAIASGTQLLHQTRRLTSPRSVAKRSEDTGIFIGELLVSGVDSARGRTALAKMNWIHRQYGNRITNDEMIHTLALFILEPLRWIDRYEWRPLSQIERVAVFVYWREIANRMGMHDVPQTLDELQNWATAYEENHMVYAETNKFCTEATLNLYVRSLPRFMKGVAKQAAASLIEPRVRPLLGLEQPSRVVIYVVESFLALRAVMVRMLFLPRFRQLQAAGSVDEETGRIQRNLYLFEPWYVRETRWSSMKKWVGLGNGGKPFPGPEFLSEGYLPEELGPKEFISRSKEPVLAEAEKMAEYARRGGGAVLGCPFAFA